MRHFLILRPGSAAIAAWLSRDFERYARSVTAFVRLAMIRIMRQRLTLRASNGAQ
jgi:hypothetical protein